jgi:hypothetical protein
MQFFLAQVEQGKDTVCVCLRASAVNLKPPANPVEKYAYTSKSI